MRTVKEKIQNNFKCIADRCPCTCCSGWQIVIDDNSLDKYENCLGAEGEIFNNAVDWLEGTFLQKNNKDCAFLNVSGLCDLITAKGEDYLCDTCRLYPRHVEEYEDLREWSLSLSCPEAVRLLTELDDYLDFEVTDDDEDDPLSDDFEDFDIILFSKLLDARDLIFDILKKENMNFFESIAIIKEIAESLQNCYDSGDYFFMDDILEKYSSVSSPEPGTVFSPESFIKDNFRILDELERLSDDWYDYIDLLKNCDIKKITVNGDLNSDYIAGISHDRHILIAKNILMSLLYTYFPGSVYTGMIYGVTMMCLFASLTVEAIATARSQSLSRPITLSEYNEILYKYSRETEHSDLNINALLEYFDL